MYGPGITGVFALVCELIDRQGQIVGQGRGVAELREPLMLNANKAVKMALKRAQVDAVLRCAGLSQWFTQDLEDPRYSAPEAAADGASPALTAEAAQAPETPPASGYRLTRLEELPALTAARILERLIRLDQDARQVRRPHSPEAGAR